MGCSNYALPMYSLEDQFLGCDKKPVSDSLLRLWIEKACEEENYEWARECQGEIIRRNT
ncbi:hypothetical protein LCGC14_1359280 [marine sediment metagenome]|uniref:Uncharacterized protein n=1 Tax=marine sediment metagenome TaxID=412755 RepID=A0A0F9MNY1_9ZZZZ